MADARSWQPSVGYRDHPSPVDLTVLAAATEHPFPAADDLVSEPHECTIVRRHRVVVEIAVDDISQPFPLVGDQPVHAPRKLRLDRLQLRFHAVPAGPSFDQEFPVPAFAADECEAQEVEGLRLPEAAPLTVLRREATELDQP